MNQEIICIQVGQCGNQIGTKFWQTIAEEQGLDTTGSFIRENNSVDARRRAKAGVFFRQVGADRFVPRAVLVDLEPGTLDVIKASPVGTMFKPDNFVFGSSGAGNNWAKGHYREGAELLDSVLDAIRREVESCESLQGFVLFHSLGGGTGSGLGTLILNKLKREYPEQVCVTFSVAPSPKVSDVVVEPYNAVLSFHQLIENADLSFLVDNEGLFNIARNTLKQSRPKYPDLNWILSNAVAGVTAPLRFPSHALTDLRSLVMNLAPFPRLHFILLSHAPIYPAGTQSKIKLSFTQVTAQVWNRRNWLAAFEGDAKLVAAALTYCGNPGGRALDNVAGELRADADRFVDAMTNCALVVAPSTPKPPVKYTATLAANTTGIKDVFARINGQFANLFKRKAFLHWYTGEGMDEMEFQEAHANVKQLIGAYENLEQAAYQGLGDGN